MYKRKGLNYIFILTIIMFISVSGSSYLFAKADDEKQLELEPYTQEFLDYINDVNRFDEGYLPSPFIITKNKTTPGMKANGNSSLPSYYDLRDVGEAHHNYVTSIKDQHRIGSCWVFGGVSSMESATLKHFGRTVDISENHIMTNRPDGGTYDGGGYQMSIIQYLANGIGPVFEAEDPYSFTGLPEDIIKRDGIIPKTIIEDVRFIPARSNSLDNDAIKSAVYNGYAVTSGVRMDFGEYYNPDNAGLYYFGDEYPNHMIGIVGWDDNFPKEKFNTPPPGDGAFIIKNSYSSDFAYDGYFYVSYYDKYIGSNNYHYGPVEVKDKNQTIYAHDPYMVTNFYGFYGDYSVAYGNVYTATRNEVLKGIGMYTKVDDTAVEIYVAPQISDGSSNYDFSKLDLVQTLTVSYAGYHTIDLNQTIDIIEGNQFGVFVKTTTPNGATYYTIPVEMQNQYMSPDATSNPKESFYSAGSLTNFRDIYYDSTNTSISLKAITTVIEPLDLSGLDINHENGKSPVGEKIDFSAISSGGNTVQYEFLVKKPNGELEVVKAYNEIDHGAYIPDEVGDYQLIVRAKDEYTNGYQEIVIDHQVVLPLTLDNLTKNTDEDKSFLGEEVIATAHVTGGVGVFYQFLVKESSGEFEVVKDYSEESTYAFLPEKAGNYQIAVRVKDDYSKEYQELIIEHEFELSFELEYLLTNYETGCSPMDQLIELTAYVSGESNIQFQFLIKKPDGEFEVVQDYSDLDTYHFTPDVDGSFQMAVRVVDEYYKGYQEIIIDYTVIVPLSIESLTTDRPGNISEVGESIVVMANTIGGRNVVYEFRVIDPNNDLIIGQEYSFSSAYTFTPKTVIGNYIIEVQVKDEFTTTPQVMSIQYQVIAVPPSIIYNKYDVNRDQKIDYQDVNVLRQYIGKYYTGIMDYDYNGDLIIDYLDIIVVMQELSF